MKMTVVLVVLVLSGVLCVSAEVLHQDIHILGCSQTDADSDKEYMYSLDGEVKMYADFTKKSAEYPQPSYMDHFIYEEGVYEAAVGDQQVCKTNLGILLKRFKDLPLEQDAPSSPMVYPRDEVELTEKNTLICLVTGFYPAPVKFSWTKNGRNVTEGTSTNVPLINKDGTYNQFSRLDFVPQLGDIYSCSVRHVSLDQPQTRIWDVEKTQAGVGPAVFCGLGLTVGLLGVAAGTFFLIKGNECS